MLPILDLASLGIETLSGVDTGSSCSHGDAAYRPSPQLDGNLQVDPEIKLPSPGMDLDIGYYYNSSSYNGPFGYGRTISANAYSQASGSPLMVTLTRGDGSFVTYADDNGTFASVSPRNLNSLVMGSNYWLETTPLGQVTAYPLDTSGNITTVAYVQNAVGVVHTYLYNGGLLGNIQDGVNRLVTFGYTSHNLLQSIQDWAGRVTTFAYGTVGALNVLTTLTGPTGCETAYSYNSLGLLTGVTDPNGYLTTYQYDSMRRPTQRYIPGQGVTNYNYLPGQMQVSNALGYQTSHNIDSVPNLTGVIDPLGNVTTFSYNAKGLETFRQNMVGAITTTMYDMLGNPVGKIDPLGRMTTVTVDSYNNVVTVQRADGSLIQAVYGYTGSSFDTTGAKRKVQMAIDPLGNLTSLSYNAYGQVTTVKDPLGLVTTYGYDGFGNRVRQQDPLGHVWTSVYDAAGNMTAKIDPLFHATSYTYDNQNRMLSRIYSTLGTAGPNELTPVPPAYIIRAGTPF